MRSVDLYIEGLFTRMQVTCKSSVRLSLAMMMMSPHQTHAMLAGRKLLQVSQSNEANGSSDVSQSNQANGSSDVNQSNQANGSSDVRQSNQADGSSDVNQSNQANGAFDNLGFLG